MFRYHQLVAKHLFNMLLSTHVL